jgi:aryl-alcohol dehydrogenase-like predicted oxidoreductase
MGTWQTFDTEEDRTSIVDEALSVGVNLFDSSPMYGKAEQTLARALNSRRDRAMIATKIWTSSPSEGREQAMNALRLFGRAEIYQVHNLVTIGATHYDPSGFDDLCGLMASGRLDMIQVPYNPRRREAERRVLPLAAELGLGVLTHSPLRYGVTDRVPSADAITTLGVRTWAQAVLKWIASDPRVSSVLTATKTPGHPTENAQAGDPPWFDADQRERLVRQMG